MVIKAEEMESGAHLHSYLIYLAACLPALFVIVECLFAPIHPTLSCLYRVWVGKYFHQFICVMVQGGCCSQGYHGHLHTWLASCTAPHNPRHFPQAHLLALNLTGSMVHEI